jgi:hypothetical protein
MECIKPLRYPDRTPVEKREFFCDTKTELYRVANSPHVTRDAILWYSRDRHDSFLVNGWSPMRFAALLLLLFPTWVAAQEPSAASRSRAASIEASPSVAIPQPQWGWILEDNGMTIRPVAGVASLETAGVGASPAVTSDGAGNIDGAALVGAVPSGKVLSHYAVGNAGEPTLEAGTTAILLCGRENHWLLGADKALLPVEAPGSWNVSKPGEWGLSLASSISPFAVAMSGKWVYANAPPPPASFLSFALLPGFPPPNANTQLCVWGFYDTSLKGSTAEPEISVAYDDGPASVPVKLTRPLTASGSPLEIVFNRLGADIGTLFVWQGAAAERLFQQPVRAAYWNGGLRKRFASRFETRDWSGLMVTNLDPRPIALGGDAEDNVRAVPYNGFVRTSPFAHYSVTTSPGTPFLAVRYELGSLPYRPYLFSVSFLLDGQYMGYDQPWRQGTNLRSIPLPLDGRSHTVDLRNGFVRNDHYANPNTGDFGGGGFIDAVAVPPGFVAKINRPKPSSVALVLSHSVAIGEYAEMSPYLDQGPESSVAWPVQARAAKAFGTGSVVDESYAGELLINDCPTQQACTAYLVAIKAAQPHVAVGFVARMLNDFYHGRISHGECLPQYEESLQFLISAWSSEFPGVPLYVGSDLGQAAGNEALTDGCTPALRLSDWRSGIQDTVTSYVARNGADWLYFVDMSQWVPQNELVTDGIHPGVEGHVRMCSAVAELFHQPATCGVPR